MYVCILCIYIHTCKYIYIYIYIHIYIYTCIHILSTPIYIYTHIHIYMYTCICIRICKNIFTRTHAHTHTHTSGMGVDGLPRLGILLSSKNSHELALWLFCVRMLLASCLLRNSANGSACITAQKKCKEIYIYAHI